MNKVYGKTEKNGRNLVKKPAANTVRNKKTIIIAFLFRCYKTARVARSFIFRESKGGTGEREGHWSFLFPRRGLVAVLCSLEMTGKLDDKIIK